MTLPLGRCLSTATLAGCTVAVVLQGGACQPGDAGDDTADPWFDLPVISDLLADVGPSVILPTLESFRSEMVLVDEALVLLLAELDAGEDTSSSRASVQSGWLSAMASWQQLEVMQVGPAASLLTDVAGEGIRDEVYSWPTINECLVDQLTVGESWGEEAFFAANLVNAYGMDAMEHLLFAGPDTVCPGQVPPGSDGSWDALGETGVARNRASYARAVSGEIVRQVQTLIETWSEEGGDFSGLVSQDVDAGPYESRQGALNAVFHALFYVEKITKERKLAQPMGLVACGDLSCPEDLEGIASERELDSIANNVVGFRTLFTGGEGVGFDDFLREVGHADLSDRVLADIESFLALASSFEGTLYEGISTGSDEVDPLYAALSEITYALKVDMVTVLSLAVPSEASGDND